jgi:hypothetical protein
MRESKVRNVGSTISGFQKTGRIITVGFDPAMQVIDDILV